MSNYAEYAWTHANIPAELASVRPLGDCVLVRVVPEAEQAGIIVLPTGSRERGYQAPRMGEVIAAGPGDRLYVWLCHNCQMAAKNDSKAPKCPDCKRSMELFSTFHHKMYVRPGDRILYWRCQANEVVINDETYQFLHEEQHVLAVLED